MAFTLTVRSVQCQQTTRNTKMQLRLFILSLAVFACALPPALGGLHVLKAAAAVGAAKGAALLGAGALAAKGAALKGAVIGAAAKGAAILAAKGAVAKGALALAGKAANLAVHRLPPAHPLLVREPVILKQPAVQSLCVEQPEVQQIFVEQPSVEYMIPDKTVSILSPPPRLPSILGTLWSLWSSAHRAVQHHPVPPAIRAPIIYQNALPSSFYPAPPPYRIEEHCA